VNLLRILIVDDHGAVRHAIRSLLESRSDYFVCGEAVDGVDAVEKTKQLRPDVVLMDISMPRMDGLEATRILRREFPESDVIIVTQNDPSVARQQAAGVNAQGFIAKADLAQDLLLKIEDISASRNEKEVGPAISGEPESHESGDLFNDASQMAVLMRSTDWSKTALGPVKSWSPTLRMMIQLLLANRFPQLLWWGPRFCCLYNDAYIPILGAKHPWAIGRPTEEVWREIWHILKPLIDTPYHGGPATWMEDIPLEINRSGFVEETHFTIAYSPVPDETVPGGIGGVLATVHEISEKVVGERRIIALRDLGTRSTEPKSAEEACEIAAQTLGKHAKDIPFALLYLVDGNGTYAYLASTVGVDLNDRGCPKIVTLESETHRDSWPLAASMEREEIQLVQDLAAIFENIPSGPWSDPPSSAVVVPIRSNVLHQLAGFVVTGISPRLRFDNSYRGFLELLSAQIATTVANARAYE